jgi:beta-glucosidase
MARATMHFPPDFLWGTATSAHQVEGNNSNNDWWRFEQEGHITGGQKSGLACNWWTDAESDLDLAAEIGTNAHRLSLEWSRIEPEPSVFDDDALARYREILQALHDRGMAPMVTLHHFANPLWLADKGDFECDLVLDYFQRFVTKVVSALGDLVPHWITINEPAVYVMMRYLLKRFPPPQTGGWSSAMRSLRSLLSCHAVAYHAIKAAYPEAKVGVAKNFLYFTPESPKNVMDRWLAGRVSSLFNDLWMECMASGRLRWPAGRGTIKHLAGSFDFVGLNYYTRVQLSFPPRIGRAIGTPEEGLSDDFWDPYAPGMLAAIRWAMRHKKPIYITENGLPDAGDDRRRAYILEHLRQVWQAINFNLPIMGYYHWTLTDNFEWERGWTQRFGLIELEPESQERRWRPSAHLYQEICRSGTISSDMAARYAPELLETMFPGEAPAQRAS